MEKLDEFKVSVRDHPGGNPNAYFLTNGMVEKIKGMSPDIEVILLEQNAPNQNLFPHDNDNFGNWTVDNFGPIVIPKKGETVQLTPENIALYERVINVYEHNDSYERKGNQFIINGQAATSYTFRQDYFWAMGDNRHNSEDSRMWGFVPEDHIVGKPLFIWFSTKNGNMSEGINWSRIFTSAKKM